MIIYIPRLIESAEQAEALPIGTLAMTGHIPRIARKSRPVQWDSAGGSFGNRHINGWTALVPIEVEEETVERHRLCQAVPEVLHRFTTPWTLYTAKETP